MFAFQWRKVCKLILSSLGLASLFAILCLCLGVREPDYLVLILAENNIIREALNLFNKIGKDSMKELKQGMKIKAAERWNAKPYLAYVRITPYSVSS